MLDNVHMPLGHDKGFTATSPSMQTPKQGNSSVELPSEVHQIHRHSEIFKVHKVYRIDGSSESVDTNELHEVHEVRWRLGHEWTKDATFTGPGGAARAA